MRALSSANSRRQHCAIKLLADILWRVVREGPTARGQSIGRNWQPVAQVGRRLEYHLLTGQAIHTNDQLRTSRLCDPQNRLRVSHDFDRLRRVKIASVSAVRNLSVDGINARRHDGGGQAEVRISID